MCDRSTVKFRNDARCHVYRWISQSFSLWGIQRCGILVTFAMLDWKPRPQGNGSCRGWSNIDKVTRGGTRPHTPGFAVLILLMVSLPTVKLHQKERSQLRPVKLVVLACLAQHVGKAKRCKVTRLGFTVGRRQERLQEVYYVVPAEMVASL